MIQMSHDTREKIIQSASELIYASSYSDVGVQAICNHAGVKKGSFYHFFASKRELALAMIDAQNEQAKNAILDPSFASDIPPLQRFTHLLEMMYQLQTQSKSECDHVLGCPIGNLAAEMSTRDEILRQKLDSTFAKMKQLFKNTLQQAVDAGDISDIDLDNSADALLAYFEGIILLAKTRNDPDIIRKLVPNIKGLLLAKERARNNFPQF